MTFPEGGGILKARMNSFIRLAVHGLHLTPSVHRFSHGVITGNSGSSALATFEGCNGGGFLLRYQVVTGAPTEAAALVVCFRKFD